MIGLYVELREVSSPLLRIPGDRAELIRPVTGETPEECFT
jgi:hypothetical protein